MDGEVHIKRKEIAGKKVVLKEINGKEEVFQDGIYKDFLVKLRPNFFGCPFTLIVKTDKNGDQNISIGEQEFADNQLENITFYQKED